MPKLLSLLPSAPALGALGAALAGLSALLVPGEPGTALAVLALGGGVVAALTRAARAQRAEREQLLAAIGEVKVRLAANAIRLEGLGKRLDDRPMREEDAAPARASLNEMTAEVGLLGDLIQQLATALADHDDHLASLQRGQQPAKPPALAIVPAAAAPVPALPAPAPAAPALATPALATPALAMPVPATPVPATPVPQPQAAAVDPQADRISLALADGKVEIHLQPIVRLPQRRTLGYEAQVRLRLDEATLLRPSDFLAAVEERGFGPTLDALVLTRALAIARHLAGKPGDLFVICGFSAATWGSTRALATLARILEKYSEHAGRLVIGMPQSVFRTLDPASLGLLGAMSANGARFALDGLTDLRFDPAALFDRGVRFVKAPAALLLAAAEAPTTDIAVSDLPSLLARASVALVADRVGDDPTVADMLDLGIVMAQGDVFSPARPVKPEVFADPEIATAAPATARPTQPPASVERLPDRVPTPPPERLPLRAVLRRASA